MAWNEPGGNSNDPWGNKKPKKNNGNNQGPPDLDEAIQQLMDKFSEFLGGKKRSGGSNSNNSSSGGMGILLILLLAVGGFLIFSSFYTLDEQERGVLLRMGKFESVEKPGLHFKIPLIDQVIKVNATKVREAEIKERMLTEDENIVEVELNAQYQVTNPVDFALRVEQPETTLRSAAESALRHEVGSTAMDDILTIGRAVLATKVQARLQDYLNRYKTGITLTNLNIKDARPPAQVKEAFDDVQKAKQDKERFINEAQAYSNSIVPEARGRAQRQREEAKGYKERVIARAKGETKRFEDLLTEYKKAPRVTRERLYIDAISELYQNSNKVMVNAKGSNNMMYLPLDQLLKNMPKSVKQGLDASDINAISNKILEHTRDSSSSTQRTQRSSQRGGR